LAVVLVVLEAAVLEAALGTEVQEPMALEAAAVVARLVHLPVLVVAVL
jgi:hypothetical protein